MVCEQSIIFADCMAGGATSSATEKVEASYRTSIQSILVFAIRIAVERRIARYDRALKTCKRFAYVAEFDLVFSHAKNSPEGRCVAPISANETINCPSSVSPCSCEWNRGLAACCSSEALRPSQNNVGLKATLTSVGVFRVPAARPGALASGIPSLNALCGKWQDAQLTVPPSLSFLSKKSSFPRAIFCGV